MNKIQIYNLFQEKNKRKKLEKGMLISFEGLDGSAKNTQVQNLSSYLQQEGYNVHVVSFPQYETLIGEVISSYLRGEFGNIGEVPHELICLAYASDRATVKEEIQSYISKGYIVLADRYTYSNLFTAAKMSKEKRTDFINWIEKMEFEELGIIKPDYNFFLYVDLEISLKRISERGKREYQDGKEDIHENNAELLSNVIETYTDWANSNNNWYIINQMKNKKQMTIEEVFEVLKSKVNLILE